MTALKIRIPDDWHLHLRDGKMLTETVAATARCFQRAIIMPNLLPPVTNAEQALAYHTRIEQARPQGNNFQPLMTLYLTNNTQPEDIVEAKAVGVVAAKLYPAGATTNSAAAVTDLEAMYPVFEKMAEVGMLLLIHGEVTDKEIDIFDREKIFLEQKLNKIIDNFSHLKIVLEHITTKDAAQFVLAGGDNLAATITPQHLLMNRNNLLVGGVRPHNFCLPVLKRNTHQQALQDVVKTGSSKFFLGTDSAPHPKAAKENACGCAGCYSAWSAIELYAQVFDELGALDKLEAFASEHGANFYGLPLNQGSITLVNEEWQVPAEIMLPNNEPIVPFYAGQNLTWKVQSIQSV